MDRDLVEQARRGDREAFAVLVHQVSDSLYTNINAMQACGATDGSETLQLGGATGRLLTWQKCPVFLMWATVLNAGRAYNVIWINSNSDGNATLQAADKARFLRVLASFAFTSTPASPTPSGSVPN